MDKRLANLSCTDFASALAARQSVPGGGATAALTGAMAAALGQMSAAFTCGKPRFADVEDDLRRLMDEAADVRSRLIDLVDEDAQGFLPLMRAYAMAADDPARADAIEAATSQACMAPLAMMGECCRAIVMLEEVGEKCSRMLVSDVASGALLARAALEVAAVNVHVNTSALKDRAEADIIDSVVDELIEEYPPRAARLARAMGERL